MAKIGIVTVLYNSASVLEDFFRTLSEQTFKDFVLYVIDNKSPDDSLALSYKFSEQYKDSYKTVIIENEKNDGVARGNNIGINRALKDECEYVLLSNNDVVLENDTITKLLNGLTSNKADLAVPKIYYYGSNLIWAAGGRFNNLFGDTSHFGDREEDMGKFNETKKVEYSATCFMLINASLFQKVGLMDEIYFVYYDDTDFVYRAVKKCGMSLYYIHNSIVHHKESVSTGVMSYFTVYHCNRNMIYFTKKNRGVLPFLWIVCLRFLIMILWHSFTYNATCKKAERNGFIDGIKMTLR